MSKKTIPAISIIIPMYNAEKYVGECLDSILAQTFDDYEVIVVDDGSTDNSCVVVESYLPKFNNSTYYKNVDKLRLIKSKVNSGGAGTPRNIGIRFSYGDYIFLMDSDDAIVENALTDLYKTAESFQADVVHCDKFYRAVGETVTTDKNLLQEVARTVSVTRPTLLSSDLAERVKRFIESKITWEPWNHLIRRDLIINNEIKFSNLSVADDLIFSFFIMCLAERVILTPNTFYVWRINQFSNSRHSSSDVERQMHRRGGDVLKGIMLLDKFVDQFELFQKNPDYRYAVFDFFTKAGGIEWILDFYNHVPTPTLYELIRKEITELEGDTTALTAFFFSRMNAFNAYLIRQAQVIQKQQTLLQQLQANFQQDHDVF